METAKWESWHKLGVMTKMDAMRHYVGQLEKNQPDWWSILSTEEASQNENLNDGTSQLTEEGARNEKPKSLLEKLEEATAAGSWSTPYLTGTSKPIARYEHGVAFVDEQMYIIGGNCSN